MKHEMKANEMKKLEAINQPSKTIGQKIFGLLAEMDHYQIRNRFLMGPADTINFSDVLDPRFRRDT